MLLVCKIMKKKVYDYVILGGGMGGLSIACLLANIGKSVCIIEANSKLGGHAYTMKKGKYSFCHDVQYLMGCHKGAPINRFLKQIGLDEKIKFNKLDSNSYDLISIKNKKVNIPFGMDNYLRRLKILFPEYKNELEKYFEIEKKIFNEAKGYKRVLSTWDLLKAPWRHINVIKYMHYTLEDVFDKFKFPDELRAILAGRIGNLSASPKEVSFLMYAGMDVVYTNSAHFPAKGMEFFVEEIAEFFRSNKGCKISLDTKVENIRKNSDDKFSILTTNGVFEAYNCISNIDPKITFNMFNDVEIPWTYSRRLKYNYSDSIFCIYLGLKNVDLVKKGFKKRNIWHHSRFDLDKEYWDELKNDSFAHPWLFISTPSLLADPDALCPKGDATFEILTFVNYDHFKQLYDKDRKEYDYKVKETYDKIMHIIEKNYFPDIRKHINCKIVHTPIDMERLLSSPKGNVYGCRLTPKNWDYDRITSSTPIENFYLVGANASFPGVMGVILGSLDLFEDIKDK